MTKTKKASKKSSPKAPEVEAPKLTAPDPVETKKPRAKVKKVKAAVPEAPQVEPDALLTWLPDAPQVTEDSYRVDSWTTADGRYQVQRCEDTKTQEVIYFGAQYRDAEKGTWWSCYHHKEGKTYAVHYPSLDRAFEAAELFHCEKTGRAEVQSNKEDVLAQAHQTRLGGKETPAKDKPARKRVEKTAAEPVEKKVVTPKAGKAPSENGPSNKEQVYRLFEQDTNVDPERCFQAVAERVKVTTVRGWLAQWKRGQNLPACAKNGSSPAPAKTAGGEKNESF